MKSKISIIACFAAVAMLILPATVSAWNLNPSAWTNETSYTIGDPVEIYVDWEVTDPQFWGHEYCFVSLNPHPVMFHHSPMYDGDYTDGTPPTRSGVVFVTCIDDDGNAYYEWDSSLGWEGTWIVDVYIVAYDSGQPEEDRWINDELSTNTFTLSPP